MTNVHTHARFGANLDQLKAAGVDVNLHMADEDLSDVVLAEPAYGEVLLGDLLPEEKVLFIEFYRAMATMEGLTREYVGAAISRIGNTIRQSDKSRPLHEAIKEDQTQMDFGTEENKQEFFRLQAKINLLRANLYWSLGERFNAHDFSIGVRTKFRAVKTTSKA